MAARKRRQARKKKTTKSKKRQTKQQVNSQSGLQRLVLSSAVVFVCILAMFQLGIVGTFLNQFFNYFVGSLTYILLIASIVLSVYYLFQNSIQILPKRYLASILCFVCAWLLLSAILTYRPNEVWYGFKDILSNTINILSNQTDTSCGLIGALLLGLFGTLFGYIGCYIFIVFFVILGIVFVGYEQIKGWINNFSLPKREQNVDDLFEDEVKPVDHPAEADPFPELDMDDLPETIITAPDPIEFEENEPEPTLDVNPLVEFSDDMYADYKLPPLSVLDDVNRHSKSNANSSAARSQGKQLIRILEEFDIKAELVEIHIGPTVTKFEIKPDFGVRVNRISNLQDDIKMGLAATDIRIEAPIPGKSAIGIEIPNVEKTSVQMKELIRTIPSELSEQKLAFCVGKDLMGSNVYGRLDRMPHLLIAGATGSGKSVCVNTIICSILMRARPDEVKMVLIDPKKVEFTPYNDVPHLLAPVITDGEMANKALKVVVNMMDKRYNLFGEAGVRNIQSYNQYVVKNAELNLHPLPQIVVIIDELADLMLVGAKEVEASIQRITQLARAAGIYLIVATQRPSVDVITGVIKANIPSRIAFAVSSNTDSRTILDQVGAERLLGNGDMLYLPNGETSPNRIQGVFIKDSEVNQIASYVKSQAKPKYDDAFIKLRDIASQGQEVTPESADPLYRDVKQFVIQSQKASTSLIQRKFSVGYSRAARLMDILEAQKIIGPANGSKPRQVLVHNTLEDPNDSL